MKSNSRNLFLLPALIAALNLIPAGRLPAQTFTTLHRFTAVDPLWGVNSDGAYPYYGLIIANKTLYGVTYAGGTDANGTLFKLNLDGTGFTTLLDFARPGGGGLAPQGPLLLSGDTLYGTTGFWLYAVNTDGQGYVIRHNFNGPPSDGFSALGGLILSGSTLYGTTQSGGSANYGVVFAINTDGTGLRIVHSFTAPSGNSDGARPAAGVILSGNTLYGTAPQGGSSGNGTVFAVNTAGTGFTNLYTFAASATNSSGVYTNSDGASPYGALILSGNTLYGTANGGGSSGSGSLFAINTNGTGFTNLHNFTAVSASSPNSNSDGANPFAGLILSGNTLYGTAYNGGSSGKGNMFAVNADGTGFTNLHNFTGPSDGAHPSAGLILSGNTLYGTAYNGGSGNGTVFSRSLPLPRLTIIPSGANVVLTWTNAAFGLQSAPAITGTFTNLPGATSPYTNAITGAQQFFRLVAN